MPRFKWTESNVDHIAEHNLTPEEVEFAFGNRGRSEERGDGSFEAIGRTSSGRPLFIVWRYNDEFAALEEDYIVQVVYVITAY